MNHNKALVIVDAQRCFMPSEEGLALNAEGFGELPVPNGQTIVHPLNKLTLAALIEHTPVLTTQDQHPDITAHFSDNPNFIDTWPVHGRKGTPGGELHPDLLAAIDPNVVHFIKGDEAAKSPAEDTSYSGAVAHHINPETGEDETLPDYLHRLDVLHVYIGGLTIGKDRPLCVDSTAIDLHNQGFNVHLVTDTITALVPGDKDEILYNLKNQGMKLTDSRDAVADMYSTPEEVLR
jgi:nicotinamidase/pyrazinamidase